MRAPSHNQNSAAAGSPRNIFEDLRRYNARQSELAQAREMRRRIERAVQAARERRFRSRG